MLPAFEFSASVRNLGTGFQWQYEGIEVDGPGKSRSEVKAGGEWGTAAGGWGSWSHFYGKETFEDVAACGIPGIVTTVGRGLHLHSGHENSAPVAKGSYRKILGLNPTRRIMVAMSRFRIDHE